MANTIIWPYLPHHWNRCAMPSRSNHQLRGGRDGGVPSPCSRAPGSRTAYNHSNQCCIGLILSRTPGYLCLGTSLENRTITGLLGLLFRNHADPSISLSSWPCDRTSPAWLPLTGCSGPLISILATANPNVDSLAPREEEGPIYLDGPGLGHSYG
jgi:hypothetical protein